jgi:hypothetical protein
VSLSSLVLSVEAVAMQPEVQALSVIVPARELPSFDPHRRLPLLS